MYQYATGGEIGQILTGFLIQKRWTVLWYLTALWLVNILYYGITSVCRSTKQIVSSVCILGILGLVYFKFGGKTVFWNADVCLTAIPFFAMGNLCKCNGWLENDRIWKRWGYFFLSAVCYAILVYLNWVICRERFDMCANRYGIWIMTLPAIFFGSYCVIFFTKNVNIAPVEYLGRNSLVYYGWHANIAMPVILSLLRNRGLFQSNSILDDICKDTILFVGIFAILYPVEILFRKTKLRYCLGKQ